LRCGNACKVLVTVSGPGQAEVNDDDRNVHAAQWLCVDRVERRANIALLRTVMACSGSVTKLLDDQVQLFDAFRGRWHNRGRNQEKGSKSHVFKEFCMVQKLQTTKSQKDEKAAFNNFDGDGLFNILCVRLE
jgi:hypothetical protein